MCAYLVLILLDFGTIGVLAIVGLRLKLFVLPDSWWGEPRNSGLLGQSPLFAMLGWEVSTTPSSYQCFDVALFIGW